MRGDPRPGLALPFTSHPRQRPRSGLDFVPGATRSGLRPQLPGSDSAGLGSARLPVLSLRTPGLAETLLDPAPPDPAEALSCSAFSLWLPRPPCLPSPGPGHLRRPPPPNSPPSPTSDSRALYPTLGFPRRFSACKSLECEIGHPFPPGATAPAPTSGWPGAAAPIILFSQAGQRSFLVGKPFFFLVCAAPLRTRFP